MIAALLRSGLRGASFRKTMKQWIKIQRIPGVLASSYEKATRLVIDGYYSQVADEIASSFTTGTMLDLGTGPGYLPVEIVKRKPKINIIGIDLSKKLIHMAQANASKAGLSGQLRFEIGNAANLRFDDDVFDMVLSTGMLHSLKDPERALKEIYRVLKKGGQAWVFDPAKVASDVDRAKWKVSLSFGDKFFLRLFKLLGLHKSIATYRRDEVLPMIEASGFKDFQLEEYDNEIRIKLKK
jgi:ubiquinone/menaquinone biosynthesis C-methylase UbiE